MSRNHPELYQEQAYIRRAAESLEKSKHDAQAMLDQEHSGADRLAVRRIREMGKDLLRRREEAEDRICFGRLDRKDGQTLYIGRELIEPPELGKGAIPLVISWMAPAATAYYEAAPGKTLGVARRRHFDLDGLRLLGIEDENFAPLPKQIPDATPAKPQRGEAAKPAPPTRRTGDSPPAFQDRLLRELERGRTAEMRDIVPTIQRDQHELIRADRQGVFVIQGGPGTGKTAVALHRAAWLAYNNRSELGVDRGVVVVGPNQAFMQYVSSVLPGLGERSVTQLTIDKLVVAQDPTGRTVQSSIPEDDALAVLKGDPRMSALVQQCALQRVRIPSEGVTFKLGRTSLAVSPEEVSSAVEASWMAGARRLAYMEARTRFRENFKALARTKYAAAHSGPRRPDLDEDQLTRALNASTGEVFNVLQRIWPTMSAPQLVHELFTVDQRMSDAARDILAAEEQESLMRRGIANVREHPWTRADLPIVDEADAVLNGARSRTSYGYAIVDEAQDLTPMQLRMIARRARGEMTLVGDIAQATGPWTYQSWEKLVDHLPRVDDFRKGELVTGYRVPEPIMRLASTLLPRVAPDLTPVNAVREGVEPAIEEVERHDLPDAVAVEAELLKEDERTVGVVVPKSLVQLVRAALADAGQPAGDVDRDALEKQVTILTPSAAKGLEFDNVVVVEPALIVSEARQGFAELYVALSRPTQRLSVVHSQPLPAPMPGGIEERPDPDEQPPEEPPSGTAAEPRPEAQQPRKLSHSAAFRLGGDFSDALVYAKLKHGAQARRGTAVPYLAHLLSVCALVLEDGGSEEEAIAALLHDAAEDHGGEQTIAEIADRFGDEVAGIVALCTDPDENGGGWREAKREHVHALEDAPASARRVALAEKLDNARAMVRQVREVGGELWRRMGVESADVLSYFEDLVGLFGRDHPGSMSSELADQVAELTRLVRNGSPDDYT